MGKMEAMDRARLRLQERYNVDAEDAAKKRDEKKKKKREQDIQDWENHKDGKGYKNRAEGKVDKEREALEQQARVKGKKGYTRPDTGYSPLMGDFGGSGSRYRPTPRGGGASGGG